jgi:hypothetical protein
VTCIVFDTPGKIDLRAFTLMGVSAKPNTTNPIGYFGTGLKYAMAVLVRLGAEPVVYLGEDKYTFFKRTDSFRGTEFEQLSMRHQNAGWFETKVIDLPYAVSYGRNWKAWMAFRELEANTRDEGGITHQAEQDPGAYFLGTRIVVDLPEFTKAWEERDQVFLPTAVREGNGIQVMADPANCIYWRGLKVYETPKPTLQTYNFLDHMSLTEDRTLQHEFLARHALGNWVVKHDDERVIERILTAGEKYWEHGIEFDNNEAPSRAFHNVALRHPKRMAPAFYSYYARHDERVVERTYDPFDAHPLPWEIIGNAVHDAKGKPVFDAPYAYAGKWDLLAGAILKRINLQAPREEAEPDEPVDDYTDLGLSDADLEEPVA